MSRLKPESEFKVNRKSRPEQFSSSPLKNALHITHEFIAIVVVTKIDSQESEAVVWRSLLIGRIRPGDEVRTINNLQSYMSGISRRAKLDLGSKLNLERIRSLMRTVK